MRRSKKSTPLIDHQGKAAVAIHQQILQRILKSAWAALNVSNHPHRKEKTRVCTDIMQWCKKCIINYGLWYKVWPIKVLSMYLRLPAFYGVDQHWITEWRIPSHFHLPFSHSLNLFLAWSIFKKTGYNAQKAQSIAFEKNLHPAKTLQSDIQLFLSLGHLNPLMHMPLKTAWQNIY